MLGASVDSLSVFRSRSTAWDPPMGYAYQVQQHCIAQIVATRVYNTRQTR